MAIPKGKGGSGWMHIRDGIMEVGGLTRGSNRGDRGVGIDGVHSRIGIPKRWARDLPAIGGEIIRRNGKLGMQTNYRDQSSLGWWERAVVCTEKTV